MSEAVDPLKRTKVTKDGELDALFDYSRVVPVITLEDTDSDDDDIQILDKLEVKTRRRRPASRPLQVVQGNIENPVVNNPVKRVETDDDWLAPPTRTAVCTTQPADPHILQLRRQKEVLLNLSMQMEAETAKLEAKAILGSLNLPSNVSNTVDGLRDGDNQKSREKIVLQLQEQGGATHTVKIFVDDKFEKLFTMFAEKFAKRPVTDFTFRFDGTTLDPLKTPRELELEDEDMIEVDVKSTQRTRTV